jgi:predicted glycosyltransferase
VRRNLALAHALAHRLPTLTGRPVTGLLLSSLSVPAHQLPPGFDLVAVPSLGKTDGAYHPRHLGVEMGEVVQLRAGILRAAVLGFGPDLIVVDRHVHGLGGELDATLTAVRARRPRTKIVLGLRDVLDDPTAAALEWDRLDMSVVRRQFDAIWVYGDPGVHDLRTTGELPSDLTDLVSFTGYLSRGRESFTGREHARPYVLTMVGGGSDGLALCRAAAHAEVPAGHRHVVVTGPQMSDEDHAEVQAHAGSDTQVVRTVSDGVGSIRGAAALVAMAGYNTVAEAMTYPVPTLLVPREEPRREQLIRAQALARVAVVDVVRARNLDPSGLGRWLGAAVTRRVDRSAVALDGLTTVGGLAAELLDGGAPRGVPGTKPIRVPAPALTGVCDVAV